MLRNRPGYSLNSAQHSKQATNVSCDQTQSTVQKPDRLTAQTKNLKAGRCSSSHDLRSGKQLSSYKKSPDVKQCLKDASSRTINQMLSFFLNAQKKKNGEIQNYEEMPLKLNQKLSPKSVSSSIVLGKGLFFTKSRRSSIGNHPFLPK